MRLSLRRLVVALALALALLAAVLTLRAARLRPVAVEVAGAAPLELDANAAAEHLAGAIRFPTVSHRDATADETGALAGLRAYLERTYPLAHARLERETIGASLLYTWRGGDPKLAPVLLLSHMDVVPVEPGSEPAWTHPPFSGAIAEGFVWGRGALDDKLGVVGILEAVEHLLAEGAQPRRTVMLAFGEDEEVLGERGAQRLAALLRGRGQRFGLILDEGMVVGDGLVPGVTAPVAMVGIAEKGYLSLELTVEGEAGHSSMPPRETPIGILSGALARLESRPMPARLTGPPLRTMEALAPAMPFSRRLGMANLWLFGGLVERILARSPATDATVRTTTALTMVQAGVKENVLPSRARAVVNFRIRPGDTLASVEAHVRQAMADPRVRVARLAPGTEASTVSPIDSDGYAAVERTLHQVYPGALVAPVLVLGATDARHYAGLSDSIYRFAPVTLRQEDLARAHGVNERVGVADFARGVRFYAQLLRNAAL